MKPKKLTVFVPEDVWRAARRKIADGDADSIQAVLSTLFSQWAEGRVSAPPAPRAHPDSEDVAMIRWIMEHGTPKDHELMRANLANLETAIQSRAIQPKRKPAKPA